jgi:Uma2 family endonuclease
MLKTARRGKTTIGPDDDGRRMSLDDFSEAIVEDGYQYELAKGVVIVSEVPKPEHARQIQAIRNQLARYQDEHHGAIELVASSNECKLLVGSSESERHPDVSLYLSPEPDLSDVWSLWIPQIVVEVVSESSRKRDYEDKPPEYLALGIDEYWIVDAAKNMMTVLTRWRGQWKPAVVKPPKRYSTRLLPGFSLDLKRVIGAGKTK